MGRAAVVVAVLVFAGGCGSGAGGEGSAADVAGPIPVSAGDVRVSGSPIADGFTVPHGAVLAGGPIPLGVVYFYNDEPVLDRGWDAGLWVSGDPRLVLDEVLRQARAVGFDARPATMLGEEPGPGSYCRNGESGSYDCLAVGETTDSGRSVVVEFHRRSADGPIPPESVMHIRYSDSDRPTKLSDSFGLGVTDASLGPTPPPVPSSWPPLPRVGERFGEGYHTDIRALRVEPGSHLVAPTTRSSEPLGCAQTSYSALVSVDGDLDQVLHAYEEQAARFVGATSASDAGGYERPTYDRPDGTSVRTTTFAMPGGDSYEFHVVERPDDVPLVAISTCND